MAKLITTRNTFRAVLRSIPPTLTGLASIDDSRAVAVASMILADADRIIATITADDAPDWTAVECEHGDWAAVAADVDKLRDAFTGRTLSDLRADTAATERAVARLTGAHTGAAKVIARNESAHAALAAVLGAKGTPAKAPRGQR